MRLFINPRLFTNERRASSILPVIGATTFVTSTFSHDAGTRSVNPVPVCLISHVLSTVSTGGVSPPKHPVNKNKKEVTKNNRKNKDIIYQRGK